ncbi:MAG: DUF2188 domain-containing protein [Actinomycetota bacterium]|nr:DUF2188 domain-containing protein [Actinomycetota bacterium]
MGCETAQRIVRPISTRPGQWGVYGAGSARAIRVLTSRSDAVAVARRFVREHGGVVCVLDDDGHVVEEHAVPRVAAGQRRKTGVLPGGR